MSSIKQITLPDGNTYDFKDEVSGYIKDTGVYGIYYGTCATAAGTAAKVATLDNSDGFSLTKGVTVAIKFTNSNTIANPTLNVNSSGAKYIKRYGTTAPSTSATSSWNDNSVLILVYDGTYWQLANWLNTTYSAMSVAEYKAGTSGTARLITPANLKAAIQYWETGGGSEPTMNTLAVTSGGTGTWYYRIWKSGWQEAWYHGSIQFTAASSTVGGWYRSTQNFALPISFADDASVLVSGAYSGRVYTHGGIKTNGTQFEAQILGGAALAANTYTGWSVYVAGYGRS